MDAGGVHVLVDEVLGLDPCCADRARLVAVAAGLAALRRWLDGRDVDVARLLAAVDALPEVTLAEAGRTGTRDTTRVLERVATVDTLAALGSALSSSEVSGAHVDVVAAALRQAAPEARQVLVDNGAWIAQMASSLSPNELRRALAAEVRELEADDGRALLDRQRRATRLRSWVDGDGMWCLHGRFDPETGVRLHQRIVSATERLFAESVPAEAPDDPVERQGFLRARALEALVAGEHGAGGPGEVIVVVDATAPDTTGRPTIDWGLPVELPLDVLHRCFAEASVSCVVVRNGVVLHAPGCLELARTARLANRAQRRVLRALYPSCAIPGCTARYEQCKLHHVTWWRHGGPTDLHNLVPLCWRHHHAVHDRGWQLALTPERQLTITYPNGNIQTTGPPKRL